MWMILLSVCCETMLSLIQTFWVVFFALVAVTARLVSSRIDIKDSQPGITYPQSRRWSQWGWQRKAEQPGQLRHMSANNSTNPACTVEHVHKK